MSAHRAWNLAFCSRLRLGSATVTENPSCASFRMISAALRRAGCGRGWRMNTRLVIAQRLHRNHDRAAQDQRPTQKGDGRQDEIEDHVAACTIGTAPVNAPI